MLRSNVGYSISDDYFKQGQETANKALDGLNDGKIGFLYTSCKDDINEVIRGVREVSDVPVVGCTSSGGIIVPDGFITSEQGFAGMLALDDPNMTVGVACEKAGKNARAIGRKVAIAAVENAKTTRAPAYFYMVASPKEEEDYLLGIQDVIGRVPMFGGSAADNNVEGNWKIICNDKVFTDGVAVAFFYTDNEIITKYNGLYNETNKMGLITEVKDKRTIVTIDEVSSLKKYAHWINENPNNLKEKNLLLASITKPLGIKDPLGNLTVIRHPMIGNDMGTKTIMDDTITLGNNVVTGTAIVQLESTKEELIEAPLIILRNLKKELFEEPAAYILIHDAARTMILEDNINEIADKIIKEANGVPFIMPFTFGEYGYEEHSSNICGGLMLSFTAIGKK